MEHATKNKKTAAALRKARRDGPPTAAIVVGVILLALVAVVVFTTYQTIVARSQVTQPIEGIEQFPGLERGHIEAPVAYAQTPPVGGQHHPAWQNCGTYTQRIQNENAVHSLEHGAVWITNQPNLPAAEVQTLQSLTRQSGFRRLSPYPDLPSPIVASARGLPTETGAGRRSPLERFIKTYEQSPLAPEPGAVCYGGLGQPQ